MSKPICCQCRHYYGFGARLDYKGKRMEEKVWRCHSSGSYVLDHVLGKVYPSFTDCIETNKFGRCRTWEPKWIIRLLMWRPKWLRTAE